MDDVKATGAGNSPLSNSQMVAQEATKFFPTDFLIPIAILIIVTLVELRHGSENSALGLLATAPLVAAIFGSPRNVSLISAATLICTGWLVSRVGSAPTSELDLLYLVILGVSILAIVTANIRLHKDQALADALKEVIEFESVERMASTDWLTGELNRRGVSQALGKKENKFQSVVMFDIDGLKKVNDAFGHLVGDEYVKHIASRISANFKAEDIFGRWGGDEFVAILPLDEIQAVNVVNRVINEAHSSTIVTQGIEIEARVSAGIAPWIPGADLDEVLARADEALYGAKSHGGSQAVSYTAYQEAMQSR